MASSGLLNCPFGEYWPIIHTVWSRYGASLMPSVRRQTQSEIISPPLRWGWLLLTWVCIALALIGALLPGLPTTIFVLVAAWSASRCSPRLRGWLEQHRLLGPCLHNWEQGGFIDRRTKWCRQYRHVCGTLYRTNQYPPPCIAPEHSGFHHHRRSRCLVTTRAGYARVKAERPPRLNMRGPHFADTKMPCTAGHFSIGVK